MKETTTCYCVGGLTIALRGPSFAESRFLAPFCCEEAVPQIEFTVSVGHPTLPTGLTALKRTLHTAEYLQNGRRLRVMFQECSEKLLLTQTEEAAGRYRVCLEEVCLPLYDTNLVLKLLELPKLLLEHGGIFLHASFINDRGRAILFTAPKQTGKSTQAALWQRYRGAEIVNGDRALLRRVDGCWRAYGSPYCGTSGICENRALPLRAVVLLRQGKRNELRPAYAREAAAAFWMAAPTIRRRRPKLCLMPRCIFGGRFRCCISPASPRNRRSYAWKTRCAIRSKQALADLFSAS